MAQDTTVGLPDLLNAAQEHLANAIELLRTAETKATGLRARRDIEIARRKASIAQAYIRDV